MEKVISVPWCRMTELGHFLRQYRINHSMILRDMAVALGVKPSRLSDIEYGREDVPEDFVEKLTSVFKLSQLELRDLKNALE